MMDEVYLSILVALSNFKVKGHVDFRFWKQHKHHHVFYNPSPFSVIADEWVDQVKKLFI